MIELPDDVRDWLRQVFRDANIAASRKLSMAPNTREEALDLCVIDSLQGVAVPYQFEDGWTVHIATHFLGHTRLWPQALPRWEIADIGLLVTFRTAGQRVRTKLALLQSKRLYAEEDHPETDEEYVSRYRHGFGRLDLNDADFEAAIQSRHYELTPECRYKALRKNDDQFNAIREYEEHLEVPVYYLLYNPWQLPHFADVPLSPGFQVTGECEVGCRVVPARSLRQTMDSAADFTSPSYKLLAENLAEPFRQSTHRAGWPFEFFIVDLLLTCQTGRVTDVRNDDGLYNVFYRRSGPIAAAIAISIDAPAGVNWDVQTRQ